ncbi:MAG TPA: hypothetical protein VF795_06015 [Desulfuromonadaceae bacterium]
MRGSDWRTIMAAALLACVGVPGLAAGGNKPAKPYPHYWMSIATSNQSIPGMGEEMAGMAAMFGGRGPAFGPRRDLELQLESPRTMPAEPEALHGIPPGQNMGNALALATPPEPERREQAPDRERGTHETGTYEKPKARMLIYWGCGEAVGQGQPRVIDTATMTPADFGKALAGRTPTRQMPPRPHKGWVYGDWPNPRDRKEIPADSSLVGDHLIHGNYVPDIRFTLDRKRDFMAPVEFTSIEARPGGAMKVEWKAIPTAIGYFAAVVAHDEKSGDTIIWTTSKVPETGFALMDYLTPGDVSRFIRDKVVMEPSRTSCTVPPVFKETAGAMLRFIAYGEELNLIHPPKPKDPRQHWEPQWSVKARLKSTGMTPLMASGEGAAGKAGKPARAQRPVQKPRDEEDEGRPGDSTSDAPKPKGGIGDRLRGLFGL